MKNIKGLLELAWKSNDAFLIEGVHGIGKSQMAEEFAVDNGMHIETLFLSHSEVGDLIGLPTTIMENGNKVTTWAAPIWLQRMWNAEKQGKTCMLFLDEMNRAQPDVLQAALQLVLKKEIHEHKLPKDTFITAAINPEDGYQTGEMDPALLDRFMHYEASVDVSAWLKWARKNELNEAVINFIVENPNRLHFQTEEKVYPTPRSWAKVSDLINNNPTADEAIMFLGIKGKLGAGVGTQFFQFFKNQYKVVKFEEVDTFIKKSLKEGKEAVNVSKELDNKYINKQENVWILDTANKFVEKYVRGNKQGKEAVIIFLDSIPLELLASVMQILKVEDYPVFQKLLTLDKDQKLLNKIIDEIEF